MIKCITCTHAYSLAVTFTRRLRLAVACGDERPAVVACLPNGKPDRGVGVGGTAMTDDRPSDMRTKFAITRLLACPDSWPERSSSDLAEIPGGAPGTTSQM
jgi:hypothetical protein